VAQKFQEHFMLKLRARSYDVDALSEGGAVMRNLMGLLLVPALLACAHTNVSDMGAGLYAVTGTGSEKGGTAAARNDALGQAAAFCAKSGRKPAVEAFDDRPLTPWGPSTSSVVFRCN
jgi:hypothetical protein